MTLEPCWKLCPQPGLSVSWQCQAVMSSYQVARLWRTTWSFYCFQFLPFGKGLIKKCPGPALTPSCRSPCSWRTSG